MKNTIKPKHYITLCATILGLGLLGVDKTEAAVTTATDLDTLTQIAQTEMEENQFANGIQPRAGWDISSFGKIQTHPKFIDRRKLPAPVENKYAFNLSRTSRTTFVDAKVNQNNGSGNYVELSAMNVGDVFYITNCGYYQTRSLDLKVKIKDMHFEPSPQPGVNSSLNLMVTDTYFAGINFLGVVIGSTNYVELEYTTIDSDTKLEVATSGILPYNNGAVTNIMTLNTDLITNVYGVDESVMLYKENAGQNQTIFGTKEGPGSIPAVSPPRELTVLYDDVATRTFRYESSREGGYTMSPRSPLPIALSSPDLVGNEYAKEPEMYYEVTQAIPLEPLDLAFKDFSFEFPLESVLKDVDPTKIEVTTDRGNTLVLNQDYKVHSQKVGKQETVSIEILESFRNAGTGNNLGLGFYGRTITAKMPVELDDTQDLRPFITPDQKLIRVPLTATTKVDSFYKSEKSNEAFAEMTNQGKLTITHVDEQGRNLIPDIEEMHILGSKWPEKYINNGGYTKDKIKLSGQEVTEIEVIGFNNPYEVSFLDGRYDFSLAGKTTTDPVGATANQEDQVDYQLNLKSSAAQSFVTPNVNHYQTVKVTLAGDNLAFLENHSAAELKRQDGTVVATGVYDAISKAYLFTMAQNVTWDNDLFLSFSANVKADAEVGKTISVKPKVELTFDGDALSFAGESTQFDTEVIKAKLELISHPEDISFGEITRTTFGGKKIYPIKSMGKDLIVQDERVAGFNNGWRISATLESDFKTTVNGTDYTLPNILKYKKGTQLTDLDEGQKVLIYNKYTDTEQVTNISKDWIKNEEGLVLELFAGDAKDTEYTATVLWELEDAF